jgi:hypothetical protein
MEGFSTPAMLVIQKFSAPLPQPLGKLIIKIWYPAVHRNGLRPAEPLPEF